MAARSMKVSEVWTFNSLTSNNLINCDHKNLAVADSLSLERDGPSVTCEFRPSRVPREAGDQGALDARQIKGADSQPVAQ